MWDLVMDGTMFSIAVNSRDPGTQGHSSISGGSLHLYP